MNFNLFDDMDGLVLRERENSLSQQNSFSNTPAPPPASGGYDGNISRFPQRTPLAMAYVPFQQWGETYSEDEAFQNGTLFPELNFPFEGGGLKNE